MTNLNPDRKAEIDRKAIEALAQAREATKYDPFETFCAAMNDLRGMCPDGCCGGVYECYENAAIERPDLVAEDEYMVRVTRRGCDLLRGDEAA